jgi:hypothetical protein
LRTSWLPQQQLLLLLLLLGVLLQCHPLLHLLQQLLGTLPGLLQRTFMLLLLQGLVHTGQGCCCCLLLVGLQEGFTGWAGAIWGGLCN